MNTSKPLINLSVVLPAYKEKGNLEILIPEIETEFSDIPHEVIVVDDHSEDGTREMIKGLQTRYKNIVLIERPGLLGIGSALRDGYNMSKGTYILSSDADLSFTIESMRELYGKITENATPLYDVVLGYKVPKPDPSRETKIITQHMKLPIGTLCNIIVRMMSGIKGVKEYNTNFRIMRRSLWQKLHTKENRNFFLFETILQASKEGAVITGIPVTFLPRKYGFSKLNFISQAPGYFLTLLRVVWFG
ncbi:MAG: glycosyltransferase [Patescibacteria group bacterium]